MKASKLAIPPPMEQADVDLHDWAACLLLGISRCRTVDRLHRLFRDWREEIEASQRRDEIMEAMAKRKGELCG